MLKSVDGRSLNLEEEEVATSIRFMVSKVTGKSLPILGTERFFVCAFVSAVWKTNTNLILMQRNRCMEATPSLACANKCVFCWRHHTNPVGKSWQWKMDDPLEIVNLALDQHSKMIKQMKGVPGTLEFFLIHAVF